MISERRITILTRKILLSFVTTMLVFTLAGCGEDNTQPAEEQNESQQASEENQKDEANENNEEASNHADTENVAVVNGTEIKRTDFEAQLEQAKATYSQQGIDLESKEGKAMFEQIKKQVLDQMINQEVLLQEAEQAGHSASKDEVAKQMKQIKGQFESDAKFQEALEANQLTEESLEEKLSSQLTINGYIEEQIGDVSVSEEEIKTAFDQYNEQSKKELKYEEVKAQIEKQLTQQKTQEKVTKLLEDLKNKSNIEIYI